MTHEEPLIVVRTKLGSGTGDIQYQTQDGRWWKKYNGEFIGTGQTVETIKEVAK